MLNAYRTTRITCKEPTARIDLSSLGKNILTLQQREIKQENLYQKHKVE